MINEFGDINKMTLDQFRKAISYYESRISMMTNDKNITEETKNYFINHYNEKIAFLEKTYNKLQETINETRNSGTFVNENIATLDNLGSSVSDSNSFGKMSQNEKKHKSIQRFKLLGAFLLPLVGTIPFLISYRRAKQRFNNIKKSITRENIELGKFVNSSKRPYEATAGTSTPFTESDMQNLLDNQSEITSLEALLIGTTLNPAEKKNLEKKLITLKEYAQKNGYTLNAGVLSDARFNTKSDNLNINVSNLRTKIEAVNDSATQLNDIRTSIIELNKLKTEAQKLASENSKDSSVKSLISDIDEKIKTLQENASATIENGTNAIIATLDSASTTGTAKADLEASNLALDNAYNNEPTTRFGVSLEVAKKYAEEIGVDPKKLDEITTAYNNHKNANQKGLDPILEQERVEETYKNNLEKVENILNMFTDEYIEALESDTFPDAMFSLNEAENALNELKSLISTKTVTDSSLTSQYTTLYQKYREIEKNLNAKKSTLTANEKGLDKFKEIITEANSVIDATTPSSDSELASALLDVEFVISEISSDEYKSLFAQIGKSDELGKLFRDAQMTQGKLKAEIEQREQAKIIAEKNLDNYKTTIDGISIPTDKTLPSYKDDLESTKSQIQEILDTLKDPSYIEGLNSQNKFKLSRIIATAIRKIDEIDGKLKKLEEAENALKQAAEKVEEEIKQASEKFEELESAFSDINNPTDEDAKARKEKGLLIKFETLKSHIKYLQSRAQELELNAKEDSAQALIESIDAYISNLSDERTRS